MRVFAKNDDGSNAPDGLYYYECNSGCDKTSNWKRLFLVELGSGTYPHPGWDIELDANDRPRIVFFMGDGVGDSSNVLFYAWCDAASCLTDDSWFGTHIGVSRGDGESPDLELDGQGRPRVAG